LNKSIDQVERLLPLGTSTLMRCLRSIPITFSLTRWRKIGRAERQVVDRSDPRVSSSEADHFFGKRKLLGNSQSKMARNLILLMAILGAGVFAGSVGIDTARAGVDTEVILGVPLLAVPSEAQYLRMVAAAKQTGHTMLRMMLEDQPAGVVVIPKGLTVILDNPHQEATQDETGGMARIHIKGTKVSLWTTNYMIKEARYFGE
jgi:hypothetical protein